MMFTPTPEEMIEFRAAMKALAKTQQPKDAVDDNEIPPILTGPSTDSEGGNFIRYIPSMMEANGIAVPQLIIKDYEACTGLKWHAGDPAPKLIPQPDGTKVYALAGNAFVA